jgi:hypothetical protein
MLTLADRLHLAVDDWRNRRVDEVSHLRAWRATHRRSLLKHCRDVVPALCGVDPVAEAEGLLQFIEAECRAYSAAL